MANGSSSAPIVSAGDTPIPRSGERLPIAHAHNDYEHDRPLQEALARGFQSVEADVVLKEGELLVGHTPREAQQGRRTLDHLYLKPLRERVRARNGRIHEDKAPFFLLIDIKTDAEETYRVIHAQLEKYTDILARCEGKSWTPGAVTVVISGNVPRELMLRQTVRYAGIDGRPPDLESDLPPHIIPWISVRWGAVFQWDGNGDIPESDQRKLQDYVAAAHAHHRLVRFWATPEKENLWKELYRQGVDVIGSDDLPKLEAFCQDISRHSHPAHPLKPQ